MIKKPYDVESWKIDDGKYEYRVVGPGLDAFSKKLVGNNFSSTNRNVSEDVASLLNSAYSAGQKEAQSKMRLALGMEE
jgi:hypothetical protein